LQIRRACRTSAEQKPVDSSVPLRPASRHGGWSAGAIRGCRKTCQRKIIMSLINWSNKLSVGVWQLDADHIILIGLINELHHAMSEGHGEELFNTILATLKEYTVTHFSREEALMKAHKYPDFDQHKEYHETLIKHLNLFAAKYALDKNSVTTSEIEQFLQGWLLNHIKQADFAYKPYMPEQGVTC
jgi:hemerythrin